MWLSKIAAMFLLIVSGSAIAADALISGGAARVVEIVDGDTLILDDGRQVRLVDIQAPKLPPDRTHVKRQLFAGQAKTALKLLALGRTVRLSYGGWRTDRYDRKLAYLHDENRRWIQGNLLLRGLARVYSFRDNRALDGDMLMPDGKARIAGRGIWSDVFYHLRDASETPQHLDFFQVVEGKVADSAEMRGWTCLNFKDDWRDDFIATIYPNN